MNILLIGLGQMGTYYLKTMKGLGVEPASITGVDVNPDKVAAAKAAYPEATFSTDLDNVGSVQAAIIATNTPSHHRLLIELMNRGVRYFFCEKPLAINLASVQAVGHAIEKTGAAIYTYTAFLMNFSPAIERLQQRMRDEELILTEASIVWGKNRFGDQRPTPGDLEDETVHGAGIVHNLAWINQEVQQIRVSGQLTYQEYANQAAQERAHALDPSFPLKVNSSAMVIEQIKTDRGIIHCALHSSFIGARQTRRVTGVLSKLDDPAMPVYAFELNCDVKKDGQIVDSLVLTRLDGNQVETFDLPCDKLASQTAAFLAVVNGHEIDPRLTDYDEARQAVAFTDGVLKSHQNDGQWITVYTQADILSVQKRA